MLLLIGGLAASTFGSRYLLFGLQILSAARLRNILVQLEAWLTPLIIFGFVLVGGIPIDASGRILSGNEPLLIMLSVAGIALFHFLLRKPVLSMLASASMVVLFSFPSLFSSL